MAWRPTFKIYAANGSSLVYTIEYVQNINYPFEQPNSIEITNLRSQGSIIIPAGSKSYDLEIRGILTGTDYTDLTSKINSLKTSIVANTQYVLKIDKSAIATDSINVIRLVPIQWEASYRTSFQKYSLVLKALCW
jgi:hypothetical protein